MRAVGHSNVVNRKHCGDTAMIRSPLSVLNGLAMALLMFGSVQAAAKPSATASGASQVQVIAPGSVVAVDYLRFGQFVKPATIGILGISPGNAITTFGGISAGNIAIPQDAPGRGPGSFTLKGTAGQLFTTALPFSVNINDGADVMTIYFLSDNTGGNPTPLNAQGKFTVTVGGYLLVNGGQNAGTYHGTYDLTVTYQ